MKYVSTPGLLINKKLIDRKNSGAVSHAINNISSNKKSKQLNDNNRISLSDKYSKKTTKQQQQQQNTIKTSFFYKYILNCKYFENHQHQKQITLKTVRKKSQSLKRQESYRSVAKRFRSSFEISDSIRMSRYLNNNTTLKTNFIIKTDNLQIEQQYATDKDAESPIYLKTNNNLEQKKFVFDEITKICDPSNVLNNKKIPSSIPTAATTTNTATTNNSSTTTTSNRKGFMNKQEKAFKQLSAIVFGFTLCFLPYFIVYMIVSICEDCVSENVSIVTVWLGYLNSTINPWIYALSNKNSRRFLKPFSKKKKKKKNASNPELNRTYYSNNNLNYHINNNNNEKKDEKLTNLMKMFS
jgi:hypothetical protein